MGLDGRLANGLGILSAVVSAGSFVRAAESLDMTQSGVSRAIARLESLLGVRLFDRTTRALSLTDEGRQLYERIAPLLQGIEDAASSITQTNVAVRGRLRVNVDPFFSRLVLAPRLSAFLDAHPDLELDLITRDQLGDMVGEGFDMAIRFGEQPSSSLVGRKLLDTRILTVASPAYIARHGRPADPRALEDGAHSCIHFRNPLTGRPFGWEFHRGAEKLEVQARGRVMVNDVKMMHTLCLGGHGIAQVMDLGVSEWLNSGALVNLFPDWPDERFPLYALYPSRQFIPAKVLAMLDFVLHAPH
jgi:DNA-binding transcriptional LysR family regulator